MTFREHRSPATLAVVQLAQMKQSGCELGCLSIPSEFRATVQLSFPPRHTASSRCTGRITSVRSFAWTNGDDGFCCFSHLVLDSHGLRDFTDWQANYTPGDWTVKPAFRNFSYLRERADAEGDCVKTDLGGDVDLKRCHIGRWACPHFLIVPMIQHLRPVWSREIHKQRGQATLPHLLLC